MNVNCSTYYKYVNHKLSNIEQENLKVYAKTDKCLGVNKFKIYLENEYCLFITNWVYYLMKEMNLAKMSTVKPPKFKQNNPENENFHNKLA